MHSCCNALRAALLGTLITGLVAPSAWGDPFKILHTFDTLGQYPIGGLLAVGDNLYGTTAATLTSSTPPPFGYVYSLDKDGSNYQVLHEFAGPEGANPEDSLILVGSRLVGATAGGRSGQPPTGNYGTLFAMDLDGSNFEVLRTFTSAVPTTGHVDNPLLADGAKLYGTSNIGDIFSTDLDGSNFAILRSTFDKLSSGLVRVGSKLYGAANDGGATNNGYIYSLNVDGTGFQILHEFQSGPDGRNPLGELTLVGSRLYGTTERGGAFQDGAVWSIGLDGSNYEVLHDFDGEAPLAGLTLLGSKLYGTAGETLFSIDPDGTSFEILDTLPGKVRSELVVIDSTLYGAISYNTRTKVGDVFAYAIPEPPSYVLSTLGGYALLVARRRRRV